MAPACTVAASRPRSCSSRPRVRTSRRTPRSSASWPTPPAVDWGRTIDRKQTVVDQMAGGLSSLLKGRKVDVFNGWGSLGPATRSYVSGPTASHADLTADAVILAPRLGAPHHPRLRARRPHRRHVRRVPRPALRARRRPSSSAAARSGASSRRRWPTWAPRSPSSRRCPKILPGCDADVTSVVQRSFKKKGIDDPHRCRGHRAHARPRRRQQRDVRRGREHRRRRRRRVGRPPALHRRPARAAAPTS